MLKHGEINSKCLENNQSESWCHRPFMTVELFSTKMKARNKGQELSTHQGNFFHFSFWTSDAQGSHLVSVWGTIYDARSQSRD